MRRAITLSAACLLMSGCSIFEDEAQRGYQRTFLGTEPIMVTTADVRLVHQRRHPETGKEIVCAEPTPDVAKAIAAAVQLSASVADRGSGAFTGATSEAQTELAGRSTALLGLRDGLYRTCEAYANGSIGDDAYALVLSRYGQLMTTLFLGQDVAAAEKGITTVLGTASTGTVSSTFSATGPVVPPAAATKTDKGANATDKVTATRVASLRLVPEELALPERAAAEQMAQSKFRNTSFPNLIQLASLDPSEITLAQAPMTPSRLSDAAAPSAPASVTVPAPSGSPVVVVNQPACATPCPPKPAPAKKPAATKTKSTAEAKTPPPAMSAPEALMWMNKEYLDLDQNSVHLMIVACINEFDNTRYLTDYRTYGRPHNSWLKAQCEQLNIRDLLQYIYGARATSPASSPVRRALPRAPTALAPFPRNPLPSVPRLPQ